MLDSMIYYSDPVFLLAFYGACRGAMDLYVAWQLSREEA